MHALICNISGVTDKCNHTVRKGCPSPLNTALNNLYRNRGCVDVAYYLIDNTYCWASIMDIQRLLCEASRWDKLDLVKKLVEKHDVHPIGKSKLCMMYSSKSV